jgi:hypothetical protein
MPKEALWALNMARTMLGHGLAVKGSLARA